MEENTALLFLANLINGRYMVQLQVLQELLARSGVRITYLRSANKSVFNPVALTL